LCRDGSVARAWRNSGEWTERTEKGKWIKTRTGFFRFQTRVAAEIACIAIQNRFGAEYRTSNNARDHIVPLLPCAVDACFLCISKFAERRFHKYTYEADSTFNT
jgi:hypothetical protein